NRFIQSAFENGGSVRIASLSCANTTWIEGTGEDLDFSPEILRTLSDPTLAPMVLYPTTDATPLESISRAEIPAGRRLALFVIDGTWYQAKQMVRRSLLLSTLPKVSFSTTKVSEYGFRKQPAEHCLSSVEAVHLAIDAFQKSPLASTDLDRQHDQMIEIFRRMVRIQQESSIGSRSLRILAHQGSLKKPV
ncbi:MAG: DTW domain-containing protein, partial [Proteobacteria bacterium]